MNEETKQKISRAIESKNFRIGIIAIGGVIILLFSFKAGVEVGYHKASYAFGWGEHYYDNIIAPRGEKSMMTNRRFINPHGTLGTVIKTGDEFLTVKDQDGVEKTVLVSKDTVINKGRGSASLNDIKTDEHVVIIGEANDNGQIQARFVRIMPKNFPLPASTSTSSQNKK